MSEERPRLYEFGPFRLHVEERRLLRDGTVLTLAPRVFDLLCVLVTEHGRLLEKEELLKALWPESFVEEANLNVNVSALRRALGDVASDPTYIETVPKRGYRFIAPVREVASEPAETVVEPVPSARPAPARRGLVLVAAAVAVAAVAALAVWAVVAIRGRARDAAPRTVAVLPFRPLVGSESDQALELGMADALITKLGSLRQITVRPTGAVAKYAGVDVDTLAAGRELEVEAVVEGRVQRDGDRIRVTVQMMRVGDGVTIWADRFDDYFTNIFAVQDSISERMAGALSLELTRADESTIARRATENVEAYELFVRGKYLLQISTPDSETKAVDLFTQAVARDPEYAPAWAALALAYLAKSQYQLDRKESEAKAGEAADRAIYLDPNLADAQASLGEVRASVYWNFAGAERAYRRAIELNPNFADVHNGYGNMLSLIGRHDEAIRETEIAMRLDPASPKMAADHVYALLGARRFDEAIAEARRGADRDPYGVWSRRVLGEAYLAKGLYAEAIAEYEKDVELGGLMRKPATLGFAYARVGRRDEALQIVRERVASAGKPGVLDYGIALVYCGLGDNDLAFEWLERSLAEREPPFPLIATSCLWDGLRSDPRFADLVRRAGIETRPGAR